MKKIILFLAVGIFLITPNAFADYALKTKTDLERQLQQFFQEEQGNRLSTYSMRGLLIEINKVFKDNLKRPEIKGIPEPRGLQEKK